ncbi:MAG: pyrazinamidase/nicotinamidase, partial [Myxococcales bacterium]
IESEVSWCRMVHRGGEVPRLVALQGSVEPDGVEPLYRHPADQQPPMLVWSPAVDRLRRAVEERVGCELNHGLLQLYRHGRDWISEHADKTLDLRRPSVIVNVSLGQRRTMVLRPKEGDGPTERVPLPHGSLLVMSLATNRSHYHAIRQQNGLEGPRISLTFRSIGTFWDRASGAVWGVGAPVAGRAEAERRAAGRRGLDAAARGEAERAEATAMLRLFRQENGDPAFDAATAYRPGFEVADLGVLNEGSAASEGGAASEGAGRG